MQKRRMSRQGRNDVQCQMEVQLPGRSLTVVRPGVFYFILCVNKIALIKLLKYKYSMLLMAYLHRSPLTPERIRFDVQTTKFLLDNAKFNAHARIYLIFAPLLHFIAGEKMTLQLSFDHSMYGTRRNGAARSEVQQSLPQAGLLHGDTATSRGMVAAHSVCA